MGTIHLNLIPKSCVFKSFLHCGTNPYTDQFEIINWVCLTWIRASQVALGVKNPPANAGDLRDAGSIPGSERSPGGGHGSPLQDSYLENPVDRGAWRATVHGVAQSWTRLKRLSMHTCYLGHVFGHVYY